MSNVVTTHIEIDERGVAWIDDTNVKVIEVAIDKLAHGSSPEEMHFQYPHLSLAQIHAALAYYYDHQAELDSEIRARWAEADQLAAKISDPSLREKLLTKKQGRAGEKLRQRTYRRSRIGDTWHWCRNCSTWPASDYEESATQRLLTGELCDECVGRERSGECHT